MGHVSIAARRVVKLCSILRNYVAKTSSLQRVSFSCGIYSEQCDWSVLKCDFDKAYISCQDAQVFRAGSAAALAQDVLLLVAS